MCDHTLCSIAGNSLALLGPLFLFWDFFVSLEMSLFPSTRYILSFCIVAVSFLYREYLTQKEERICYGSRLTLCQTLSIECPSSIFFWLVYFVILVPFSLSLLLVCVFFCSHWSLVDVPLIFFCPADHVSDWQPRILLGMVEARSVNVKKNVAFRRKALFVNGVSEFVKVAGM